MGCDEQKREASKMGGVMRDFRGATSPFPRKKEPICFGPKLRGVLNRKLEIEPTKSLGSDIFHCT